MTSKSQPFLLRVLKRGFGSLLLVALLTGQASATIPPQTMLETVTDEIISAFKREQEAVKHEPAHLFALVEEVLLPHVDMNVMSRYVLGKYWRTATDDQKERFRGEFKDLLVRFYVSALLDDPARLDELLANSENLIRYLPVAIDDSTRKTTVRAEVTMPNGGPKIPVSFNLFLNTEGEWMMYDVNVDGISLVTNYRSSFAAEIKRDGLEALLDRMAERNQALLEEANNSNKAKKTGK